MCAHLEDALGLSEDNRLGPTIASEVGRLTLMSSAEEIQEILCLLPLCR